ncbi:MAG: peptidoglycan-associated lipoprotein [Proteobacteria bacterium]|nr:MAG: peptidoglycan-associated lipoprotein [Pseudomonadota bacterium]
MESNLGGFDMRSQARSGAARRSFAPFPQLVVLMAMVSLLAVGGCKKKSAAEEDDLSGGMGDSEFSGGTGMGDDEAGAYGGEPERVRELGSIYFDYDSASIRGDARTTLKANAQAIEGKSEWKTITLEGHTDERGTEEYNLALGEQRANAAKQYLTDLGVPASRMITVSFGEGSPAVQGHDESAWRWNRRVEFKVSRR